MKTSEYQEYLYYQIYHYLRELKGIDMEFYEFVSWLDKQIGCMPVTGEGNDKRKRNVSK